MHFRIHSGWVAVVTAVAFQLFGCEDLRLWGIPPPPPDAGNDSASSLDAGGNQSMDADDENQSSMDAGDGGESSMDAGDGGELAMDAGDGGELAMDAGDGGESSLDAGDGGESSMDAGFGLPDAGPMLFPTLRVEIPCTGPGGDQGYPWVCPCTSVVQRTSVPVAGDPGVLYAVTLRVRGVVELVGYQGGTAGSDSWYVGGDHMDDGWNIWELLPSSGPTYFVNANNPGPGNLLGGITVGIDFEQTVTLQGGTRSTTARS
jgi:hypothetical protein